jgi:membrane-associated HD superfamily phosphohydrolase
MFHLSKHDIAIIDNIVFKYTQQLKGLIVTSSQNIVNAIAAELAALSTPLATLLTEVTTLVNNPNMTVDTSALQSAADAVVSQVNAVSTAAGTPPVVTTP